ncbi:MAG: PepSY domain-containing protein, partial [Pseudomonadota bacterium]
MIIRRWAVRLHKWIVLVVGIQIFLWIAGGLVMSAIPIEVVRSEHKVAETDAGTFAPADLVPLSAVAAAANLPEVSSARLGELLDQPVWWINTRGKTHTFDAQSGERLSPIGENLARTIAEADYSWWGTLRSIELVDDPPSEYGRPGPVWRARFDDGDATTLYIDRDSGEVRARRSVTWRFYDFFWKLHVMDYDDGASFN